MTKLLNPKRNSPSVVPLALLVAQLGCAANGDPNLADLTKQQSPLYTDTSSLWPSATIHVCWENPGSSDQTERGWVRSAVEDTWEFHSGVNFVGWGTCGADTNGIRISILDLNPYTNGLGTEIDGEPGGMVLNFTFGNFPCSLTNKQCIQWIAVHEFGHALGFAHEQNRPDTEFGFGHPCDTAEELPQGGNGDETFGGWDVNSVMNYCNPKWNNDGELSNIDIAGVQNYYGPPKAAAVWDNGKAYFFHGSTYTRYDIASDQADYTKAIKGNWNNWPDDWWSGAHAAVNFGNGYAYFFKGKTYLKMDVATKTVLSSYPKPIAGNWSWASEFPDGVDAAMRFGDKLFLFRGPLYLRYDITDKTVDPGYPKPILGNWIGLSSPMALGVDEVLNWDNDKAYFFKDGLYSRVDLPTRTQDPNYPRVTWQFWPGLFF